jgi:hybrid cluster-associated redox disulfide protein
MTDAKTISPTIPIRDLLTGFPAAIPVFLKHHMTCVGCSMSGFDTLQDAASIYGLALDALLDEIRAAVSSSTSVITGSAPTPRG